MKMASAPPSKCTKVVHSVEEKLSIVEQLWKDTSYTVIAEKYGIAWSTVVNIKKNRAKLDAFKWRMTGMGVKTVATKAMELGTCKKLDEALYIW